MSRSLYLGATIPLDGRPQFTPMLLPANHLTTHSVIVGMTGSGKTGLVTVLVEEALRASIPTLVIDVKGDLPNLLLAFPTFDPGVVRPWVEAAAGGKENLDEAAVRLAAERERGLAGFSIGVPELSQYRQSTHVRVITPGADAGDSCTCCRRSSGGPRAGTPMSTARGRAQRHHLTSSCGCSVDDPDAQPRARVAIGDRRATAEAGLTAEIGALLPEIVEPPFDGSARSRSTRSRASVPEDRQPQILASPSFAAWRQGATLDVGEWMKPVDGKTPATIISVAHLDDDERALVLGVVLEEVLSWVRGLPGSQQLRALIVFDETYGFLPPHPASPPTKRPLVALMKQARAYGVGVVIATQNPMDLDYRALSNAGLWCLGRLQTDADRERVLDGLSNRRAGAHGRGAEQGVKRLAPRWFVVRARGRAIQPGGSLRGPMTAEIRRARAA
jgi:hypothetical protein